jgi:hypothetical protein
LQADITPASLTIKANDAVKVEGAANPAFTINVNDFVVGDNLTGLSGNTLFNAGASTDLASFVSGLNGALSFTTTATQSSAPGTYAITPTGLNAPNYVIHYLPGQLTVVAGISVDPESPTPPSNNPSFTQDPQDGNPPPPPPENFENNGQDGGNGLLLVVGGGMQLPQGLAEDDDDENTL